MKIKVTTVAILDTEDISEASKSIKYAIEKAAFNKENDNLAKLWALTEVRKYGKEEITLELM